MKTTAKTRATPKPAIAAHFCFRAHHACTHGPYEPGDAGTLLPHPNGRKARRHGWRPTEPASRKERREFRGSPHRRGIHHNPIEPMLLILMVSAVGIEPTT